MGRYGFTAPDVQIYTQKYASGEERFFGKEAKPRTCGLKMLVGGKDRAERDGVFGRMLDVLLDARGKGEGKLYVRRSDGSLVFLNCVYSSGMRIAEQYQRFRKFNVEFYAADPWFYLERKYDVVSPDLRSNSVNLEWNINSDFYVELTYRYDNSLQEDVSFTAGITVDPINYVNFTLSTEDLAGGYNVIYNSSRGTVYRESVTGKRTFYAYADRIIGHESCRIVPWVSGFTSVNATLTKSTYSVLSRVAGV